MFTGLQVDGKRNKVPIWDASKRKKVEVEHSHYTIVVSEFTREMFSILIVTFIILLTHSADSLVTL